LFSEKNTAGKNWSRAELAARVSVSRNSINAVENGRFDPSLPLAFRIADAIGLGVEDVFDKIDAVGLDGSQEVR
jgi:putative transcriptional regulator